MLDFRQRMSLNLYRELNPNELTAYQFKEIEKEIKRPNLNTISDEYLDFKLWCNGFKSRQEYFADYLMKKLKKYEGAKILEVGCGRTGRLSRMLSDKGFLMTGIDPKVEVTSSTNVEFIKGKLNYQKVDLSKYEYIVSQEPCDATEHIVRACIDQRIPFIISLCGVPHKLISGKQHENVYEWYNYLLSLDNDIVLRYIDLDPLSKTPILKSVFK